MSPWMHDVPVLGVVTTSFSDAFAGLLWEDVTSEELQTAFKKLDVNRSGKLDRAEVADALRLVGKSERQVQKLVDLMPEETLDLPSFQELVHPKPLPWAWQWGPLTLPNHHKILDTPWLGNTLLMANDLVTLPFDGTLRSFRKSCYPASDANMAELFTVFDVDHSGKLDKKEIASALRHYFKTESEVKYILDSMHGDVCLYDFKKMIRGPKYSPSLLNHVPILGPAVDSNVLCIFSGDIPEEDEREAFEYIDCNGKGKLDKAGVANVLRELGYSEHQVQKLIRVMPGEDLDLEGLRALPSKAAYHPPTVEAWGVHVPNPAKFHEVPVFGNVTSLVQDVVVDSYDWTLGAAFRYFKKDEAAKPQQRV